MRHVLSLFLSWRDACDGNIAVLGALLLPLLLLGAGAGVDFQRWGAQRSGLQDFADTLALKGAREFLLAHADPSAIESLIRTTAEGLAQSSGVGAFEIEVDADRESASVTVTVTQAPSQALILAKFAPYKNDIEMTATAVARGGMKVCVVALEEDEAHAVATRDSAVLDASPCSVLSNSRSPSGVAAEEASKIAAGLTCSAGGASGPPSNYEPGATTDCPPYPDPLAERAPPPVGACDHNGYQVGYIDSVVSSLPLIEVTLTPGVYCGGLRIEDFADVTFEPGIYVIKDGPLRVGRNSTLDGENVAFYLLGDQSTFEFEEDSTISMSAPKTGLLAGILFYEDRAAPLGREHRILSKDARLFLGTFYLPRGTLRVDTTKPVADSSAYTALVVRKLELKGSPTLVLNADYASSEVPVPGGLGPVGGEVFLRD
jgi:Flp pilus assembly protein TadG